MRRRCPQLRFSAEWLPARLIPSSLVAVPSGVVASPTVIAPVPAASPLGPIMAVAAIDPQPAPEPNPGPLEPVDAPITYPEFPESGPVGPGR